MYRCRLIFPVPEAKNTRRPPGKVNYQLPVANVAMINGEPGKIITDNKVNKIEKISISQKKKKKKMRQNTKNLPKKSVKY